MPATEDACESEGEERALGAVEKPKLTVDEVVKRLTSQCEMVVGHGGE